MTVVKQEAEAAKAVVEKKNLVFLPMMNRKKKILDISYVREVSSPGWLRKKKIFNFFKLLFSVVASGINRLKDRHTYKTDRSTDRQTRQIDRLTDRGGRGGYLEGRERKIDEAGTPEEEAKNLIQPNAPNHS